MSSCPVGRVHLYLCLTLPETYVIGQRQHSERNAGSSHVLDRATTTHTYMHHKQETGDSRLPNCHLMIVMAAARHPVLRAIIVNHFGTPVTLVLYTTLPCAFSFLLEG